MIRPLSPLLALVLCTAPAFGEALVAARTIRAKEVISETDLRMSDTVIHGALQRIEDAVGREARQTIYQGRPVSAGDLAEAAVIERNELVVLIYDHGGLFIRTEGRALGRGSVGARLRVMNLASRATVTGTVVSPGQISVP